MKLEEERTGSDKGRGEGRGKVKTIESKMKEIFKKEERE